MKAIIESSATVLLVLVSLSTCDDQDHLDVDIDTQEESELEVFARLEQAQKRIEKMLIEMNRGGKDRNSDGKSDLIREYSGEYYHDFRDRNFDGTMDENFKYDLQGNMVSGEIDQDFDRNFETHLVYKDHSLRVVLADTNGNGVFDLITNFDLGVAKYSERFYQGPDGSSIGRVDYQFGYPIGPEKRRGTSLTEEEFENAREF